eukprot:5475634-Amphidinium_carterae.1
MLGLSAGLPALPPASSLGYGRRHDPPCCEDVPLLTRRTRGGLSSRSPYDHCWRRRPILECKAR